MIEKIKHIIIGWWYRLLGLNLELFEQRMEQCKECSEILYLSKNEAICKDCGCFLKAKLVLEDEECPLGKWKMIMKNE